MYDCGEELASGLAPPIWYNDSLSAFLLKNPPEDGSSQVVVEHTDMRFLSLKLCCNKIVSGVLNSSLRPVIRHGVCVTQRGFVPSRNFLNNVVELEAVAILHSLLAGPLDSFKLGAASLIALLDFLAAFATP